MRSGMSDNDVRYQSSAAPTVQAVLVPPEISPQQSSARQVPLAMAAQQYDRSPGSQRSRPSSSRSSPVVPPRAPEINGERTMASAEQQYRGVTGLGRPAGPYEMGSRRESGRGDGWYQPPDPRQQPLPPQLPVLTQSPNTVAAPVWERTTPGTNTPAVTGPLGVMRDQDHMATYRQPGFQPSPQRPLDPGQMSNNVTPSRNGTPSGQVVNFRDSYQQGLRQSSASTGNNASILSGSDQGTSAPNPMSNGNIRFSSGTATLGPFISPGTERESPMQQQQRYSMRQLSDIPSAFPPRESSQQQLKPKSGSLQQPLIPPPVPEGALEDDKEGVHSINDPTIDIAAVPAAYFHHRSPSEGSVLDPSSFPPSQGIFTAGEWWERALAYFIYLTALLLVIIGVTNPFLKWFPSGKKFIKQHYIDLGIGWETILFLHIFTSSVMLICAPVLVTPYYINPALGSSRDIKLTYNLAFWVYVIAAVPGILTSFPLGAYPSPQDFATVSAFMAGTLCWTISLPFMVYYKAFKPDDEKLLRWTLRQFGFSYLFQLFKNLILHPILFHALSDTVTVSQFYGGSIWLSVFVAVVPTEYVIIPWFIKRYVRSRPRPLAKREEILQS